MRKFTFYLTKLTLITGLMLLPVMVVYKFNLSKTENYRIRENFTCERNILFGSSHGRDSFIAAKIPSSYNLSVKGFTIEQNYADLKFSLEQCDQQIETVIITFSVFTLRKINFLNNSKGVLNTQNAFSILDFFNDNLKKDKIVFHNLNQKIVGLKNSAFIQKSEKHFLTHTTPIEINKKKIAHDYFYKIIVLKKKYKFRLVFVTTPFSNPYNKIISEHKFWHEDLTFIKQNAREYNYEYYNFQELFAEYQNNQYFHDPSHLNLKGSVYFTEKLFTVLELN